jgi:hypothetical protein
MTRRNLDLVGLVGLFGWPVIVAAGFIVYGLTGPPGGLFGLARDTAGIGSPVAVAFTAAGFAYLLAATTVNVFVRAGALGIGVIATLGRALTLVVAGTPELPRDRELGGAAIMLVVFAALVLIHFLTVPDAAKVDVDRRGGPRAVNG